MRWQNGSLSERQICAEQRQQLESSSFVQAQAHLSRSKAPGAVVGSLKPVWGVNLALPALVS